MKRFPLQLVALLGSPLLLLCLASLLCADPPSVTYLFPSGGQRGTEVEVTANGTIPNWPLQAHVSSPGVQWNATDEKGKFKAIIAEDAPGGVHFVRFYDAQGASSLRPFLVGNLTEINEIEPNDEPNKPQPIDSSVVINGKLAKAGDVDGYKFKLRAGQTVVASLTAHRTLKSPMDGVMQLCDSAGFVLEQNDDELGFDPQIVFTAPRDDEYLVRTFAFPETPNSTIGFAGADTYVYRLTITTGPYLNHSLPLAIQREEATSLRLAGWNLAENQTTQTVDAAGDARLVQFFQTGVGNTLALPVTPHPVVIANTQAPGASPPVVPIPCVITGNIAAPKQDHIHLFSAKKGEAIHFLLEGRQLGYRIDPWLGIRDATGKLLKEIDDAKDQGADLELEWKAPADGDYQMQVRDLHDHGGARYVYRLTATKPSPDYHLALAAETGIVTADKPLELTVNVTRKAGFNTEIDLALVDLPKGIQCDTVTSAPKGDSAKTVKLKIVTDGSAAYQGPLKIVGQSKGDAPLQRTASFALGNGHETTEFWLTAQPKK